MSLSGELRSVLEARMRDVRHHQAKVPSGAQIRKLFKDAAQTLGALSNSLGSMGSGDLARQVDDLAGRLIGVEKNVVEEDLTEAWKIPVYAHTWLSTGLARAVDTLFIDKEMKRMSGVTGFTIMGSTSKDSAVLHWNVYGVKDGKEDPDNIVGEYRIEVKIKKVSDTPKGKGPPGGMGM